MRSGGVLRTFERGPLRVTYSRRSSAGMGRFGGGWQWKVGVQAGDLTRKQGTVIVSLLIASFRIEWDRRAIEHERGVNGG